MNRSELFAYVRHGPEAPHIDGGFERLIGLYLWWRIWATGVAVLGGMIAVAYYGLVPWEAYFVGIVVGILAGDES